LSGGNVAASGQRENIGHIPDDKRPESKVVHASVGSPTGFDSKTEPSAQLMWPSYDEQEAYWKAKEQEQDDLRTDAHMARLGEQDYE
jgi:hypothetical protein